MARVALLCAVLVSALIPLALFDPSRSPFFPPCPFHWLTGLDCPGCGTLRAIHELLTGHPIAALRLNPLMIILLPAILYHLVRWTVRDRKVGETYGPLARPQAARIVGIAIVSFWVVRNLPFYPL